MKRPHFHNVANAILACILLLDSTVIHAKDSDEDRNFSTVFLKAEGGMITHKSGIAASNDTGTGFRYTLGGHIGLARSVGVLYTTDSSTVDFGLNNGKLTTIWTDTTIRYRLGYFYLGVIIGGVALQFTPPDVEQETASGDTAYTEELDVIGSGYGVNAGFAFPFGRNNAYYLDINSVSIGVARDLKEVDVSFGSRLDIDTGVVFYVTKNVFDVVFGYRQRTFSVKMDTSYAEEQSAVYLGFRLNGFF